MPEDSRKALAYGAGDSVPLIIVWGIVIAGAPDGGRIKPVGEALVTLVFSGLGCLIVSVRQLLKAESRRLALWLLIYRALPFLTMVAIFWYIGAVKGLAFA